MDWLDVMLWSAMDQRPEVKHQREKLRALDRRLNRRIRRRVTSQEERIEALETQLGRVAMLARALAELGLDKGAFTREELERALLESDLADGQTDGVLDPDVALPGEERAADLEPLDGDA
ncbi:MAG TPA: hypothetical protein VMT18_09970 [Planctomycetota bacterium]|nr:hypothetical protein [Planctomycetota bacterium]